MESQSKWSKTEEPMIPRVPGVYYPKLYIFKELLKEEGVLYDFKEGIIYDLYTLIMLSLHNKPGSKITGCYDRSFLNHPNVNYRDECRARMEFYINGVDFQGLLKSCNNSAFHSVIECLKGLDYSFRTMLINADPESSMTYDEYVDINRSLNIEELRQVEEYTKTVMKINSNGRVDRVNLHSSKEILKIRSHQLASPLLAYKLRQKDLKIDKIIPKDDSTIILVEDVSGSMSGPYFKSIVRMVKKQVSSNQGDIVHIKASGGNATINYITTQEEKIEFGKHSIKYIYGDAKISKALDKVPVDIKGDIIILTDGDDKVDTNHDLINSGVALNVISKTPHGTLKSLCYKTNGKILKV